MDDSQWQPEHTCEPDQENLTLGVVVFFSRITRRGNLLIPILTFLFHDIAAGALDESPTWIEQRSHPAVHWEVGLAW